MSSSRDHFGYLSPPPNYQHTPSSSSASFSSFQFTMPPQKYQSACLQSPNSYPRHSSHLAEQNKQREEHYLAKYRDMKQKVKELELDNDHLHLKCLTIRKSIQRLRLERAILYERLQALNSSSNGHSMSQNNFPHATIRHSDLVQTQGHLSQPQSASFHHSGSIVQESQLQTSMRPLFVESSPSQFSKEPDTFSSCNYSATTVKPSGRNVTATSGSVDINGPTTASPPGHEVRNGSHIRTFPFVHEYPAIKDKGQQRATTMHQEHPVEIKFHQYEAGVADQRTKREVDEKGSSRQRRRITRDINRPQQTSSKRHTTTFRNHFTYSFQAQLSSPGDVPGQSGCALAS